MRVQVGAKGFEPSTSWSQSPTLKPLFWPKLPRNTAILSLRATITRVRTLFQELSGNSGIFKMAMFAKR